MLNNIPAPLLSLLPLSSAAEKPLTHSGLWEGEQQQAGDGFQVTSWTLPGWWWAGTGANLRCYPRAASQPLPDPAYTYPDFPENFHPLPGLGNSSKVDSSKVEDARQPWPSLPSTKWESTLFGKKEKIKGKRNGMENLELILTTS